MALLLGLSDKPPADDAYSFYLLEDEVGSGSVVHRATVVASDPDEIRWACDAWFALTEGGFGPSPTLLTYVDGAEVNSLDLGPYLADQADHAVELVSRRGTGADRYPTASGTARPGP